MLRSQVSSLVDGNAVLADETLGFNRELLDLEIMVRALQEHEVSSSNTVPQVLHRFVNVPIGSEPVAIYNDEPGDPASNCRVKNSSYNNSPNLATGTSKPSENWIREGSRRSNTLEILAIIPAMSTSIFSLVVFLKKVAIEHIMVNRSQLVIAVSYAPHYREMRLQLTDQGMVSDMP